MIRKPGKDDFRENQAIVAMRETKTIAVEGSKGIQQGLSRLYMIWFGGIMAFGFLVSLASVLGGVGMVIAGIIGWQWYQSRQAKKRNAEMLMAEAAGNYHGYFAAPPPSHALTPPPEPQHRASVPRSGRIADTGVALLDIGAVVQQAFVLGAAGLILIFFLANMGDDIGVVANILGIALIALAVLVGSRVVGDRKAIEWDEQGVTVWHLLGEGRMQWSDVIHVNVVKAPRIDLSVYFRSGSSRNIVFNAPLNRLGGPNQLLAPVRMMALDDAQLMALLRRLSDARGVPSGPGPRFVQPQAAPAYSPAQNTAFEFAEAALFDQVPIPSFVPAPTTSQNQRDTAPHEEFDPDAVMARYLREREQIVTAAERERAAIHHQQDAERAAMPGIARSGGFGRKGL